MDEPGGFALTTESVTLAGEHGVLSSDAEPILANISEKLWNRASNARRAPASQITFENVPLSLQKVIKDWKVGGMSLFRPAKAVKRGFQPRCFWSFRPEAAHALCRFEDMALCDVGTDDPEGVRQNTLIRAAGNARLTPQGDMAVITGPIHIEFKSTPVGPAQLRSKESMVLSFTVMVVPASRSARLKSHQEYPKISNHQQWPQIP